MLSNQYLEVYVIPRRLSYYFDKPSAYI